MHTREKEKSGTCCQVKNDQENAEALRMNRALSLKLTL